MTIDPLDHVISFWKPCMDEQELRALACYREPSEPPSRGIDVWRSQSEARFYKVMHGDTEFSLFAAVHPIEDVPLAAEVVADIRDRDGRHYSYVLWFPNTGSAIVPFDPNAAIEALWREDYVPPAKRTALPQSALSLYYSLKPALPVGIKSRLRRVMARRAGMEKSFLAWPSDDSLDQLQRLLLCLVMKAAGRQDLQFAWFWPDGRSWAVTLTHDVETAKGLARASHIADIERRKGFRSSFNLVPLDYEIPGSLLRGLKEEGFEVGVHGYTHDGLLFSKWSTFMDRVTTINECGRQWDAAGFRSPATYRNQEWFHLLGFEYDSSFSDTAPYEPQPGGCASFFPFLAGGLIELPITVPQDHTLFGLLGHTDAHVWLAKLRRIKDANGMACVLTHPDPAAGYIGMPENEAHYEELLEAVVGSNAWVVLPRDLARWWRSRLITSQSEVGAIQGMSFGRAQLGPSGSLKVVAPAG